MLKATATFVRGDEKKHSVRFEEVTDSAKSNDVLIEKLVGTLYVSKLSGLTDARKLRVTIEEG